MDVRTRSNRTFWLLLAILALSAALTPLLPQMEGMAALVAAQPSKIPTWQLVLAGAGITLLLYGALGFLGLLLWRRLGLPEIWEPSVTNRQRFVLPALVGAALGGVLIIADLLFAPYNGVGRLLHPPFPTSLVASVSAAIGEEILFRLFLIKPSGEIPLPSGMGRNSRPSYWTGCFGGCLLVQLRYTATCCIMFLWHSSRTATSLTPAPTMSFGAQSTGAKYW